MMGERESIVEVLQKSKSCGYGSGAQQRDTLKDYSQAQIKKLIKTNYC